MPPSKPNKITIVKSIYFADSQITHRIYDSTIKTNIGIRKSHVTTPLKLCTCKTSQCKSTKF